MNALSQQAGVEIFWLTRFLFQRALGFVYLIGFLIVVNQYTALVGERGLLPIPLFLKRIDFLDSPSLFWFHYSDRLAVALGWLGLGLSVLALTGISDSLGMAFSAVTWFLLWVLYLSFVNVGQTFYSFGWETLLLETGFLAIFLGSRDTAVPVILIWMLRWVLFRLMFGAGLIKLRGDPCWRDLTCMMYHYETQPMPNPLSWFFHHFPPLLHKAEVLFTHFVELIVPWFVLVPGRLGIIAGVLTFVFQFILILSGNLSWLNYMTLVLCIACFPDSFLLKVIPYVPVQGAIASLSAPREIILVALTLLVGFLSYRPMRNLFSDSQMMNASFEPLHLVNTYGAFGSITRERLEVVIEGTDDPVITPLTEWKEYLFKGKPSEVQRMPPLVSPYHLRLDWQMWFAAMGSYYQNPWILNLAAKLLQGDAAVIGLLRHNPFPKAPPKFVRMEHYLYHFTPVGDPSGNWWERRRVGEYLPPVSWGENAKGNPFRKLIEEHGWF